MHTNKERKIVNKESTDGICGKKLNKVYGKRTVRTIPNGNISFLILKNNLRSSPSFLKMILILWLWKPILSKEKRESKKIMMKLTN